jgi:hypothetical protein
LQEKVVEMGMDEVSIYIQWLDDYLISHLYKFLSDLYF